MYELIFGSKKPKIKDRKNPLNLKGELTVEGNIMMEQSFIFQRYCQII